MQKIEFKNLPNTDTPISAENLNAIQDNVENEINDSSVVVSATEPTENNRKKIWMQKSRNMFNKNDWEIGYIDESGNNATASTNFRLKDYIKVKPNTTYTISANTIMKTFRLHEYKSDNTYIKFTYATDKQSLTITTSADTRYLRFSGNYNSSTHTQAIIDGLEIQLEQGMERTEYEPIIDNKIYIKNDNDVYEEFVKKDATVTESGLMSANDKKKLNNIAPIERLSGANLNNINGNYMTYCLNAQNTPSGQEPYGFLIQIHIDGQPYKKQLWSSFGNDNWFKRTCNNGTWTSWITF